MTFLSYNPELCITVVDFDTILGEYQRVQH